jgi:hypothetical protein
VARREHGFVDYGYNGGLMANNSLLGVNLHDWLSIPNHKSSSLTGTYHIDQTYEQF